MPVTSTSAPLLGTVLGDRYEVVRHLARGGTSDVYEARDLLLQRPVAAKVFRATAPTDRARFDAEITTLASLNHPTLVAVYDAGEHDGDGYVILELVDGPTLRSILAERGRVPEGEVADLGATLADARAYVHAAGVVHRDVTPANVLCGPDGRPRLADFGIARLLDTSRVTALATAVGTAAYMAPEQLEGQDVGPAADMYGLGLVLAEARSGRPGFTGQGHEVALARLVRDPDLGSDLPPPWAELLAAMTARDPVERPTAAEVAIRMRALAADPVDGATPPVVVGSAVDLEAATTVVPVPTAADEVDDPVDPHGATTVVPAAGGTTVMPAVLRPADPDPAPPSSRTGGHGWAWAAVAVVVIGVLLLASQAGGGVDLPTTPTTATPVDATEPVVTTTAPPPTTTTPPPPPERGEGNGKGNGRGKKDDDDDD